MSAAALSERMRESSEIQSDLVNRARLSRNAALEDAVKILEPARERAVAYFSQPIYGVNVGSSSEVSNLLSNFCVNPLS